MLNILIQINIIHNKTKKKIEENKNKYFSINQNKIKNGNMSSTYFF
jgi:hypothetical protein